MMLTKHKTGTKFSEAVAKRQLVIEIPRADVCVRKTVKKSNLKLRNHSKSNSVISQKPSRNLTSKTPKLQLSIKPIKQYAKHFDKSEVKISLPPLRKVRPNLVKIQRIRASLESYRTISLLHRQQQRMSHMLSTMNNISALECLAEEGIKVVKKTEKCLKDVENIQNKELERARIGILDVNAEIYAIDETVYELQKLREKCNTLAEFNLKRDDILSKFDNKVLQYRQEAHLNSDKEALENINKRKLTKNLRLQVLNE